jgi:hypothetical protein
LPRKIFLAKIRQAFTTIDWRLLLFLVLFLNVKLIVKVAAIVLIYLLNFNFKFGFQRRNSRLPFFYLAVIGIGIFNWLLLAGFSSINYTVACVTGIFFWTLCVLAIHQVKLFVERDSQVVIHKTLIVFFLLNAFVSLAAFAVIVVKTGAINPYLYQGDYQKYFIGTGDYIRGISFDTSTTDAILNALGVIYFLERKNALMVLLCMVILLLTGSNITNFVLAAALLFVFIFQSNKDQKSIIVICLLLLVIFLAKISPQNNNYVLNNLTTIFKKPVQKQIQLASTLPIRERADSTLATDERKEKIAILYLDSLYRLQNTTNKRIIRRKNPFPAKIEIPTADINTAPYQHVSVVTPVQKTMTQFIHLHSFELPMSSDTNYHSKLPGKVIALKQTFTFFKENPWKIITGTGIANFSSKLAFKTTGLDIAGGYPEKYIYLNPAFVMNHLDLYLYYFTKEDGRHSIVNTPNSVYDQLLSEYGLAGCGAFLIFYLGFFIKKFKTATYAIPLIIFLSAMFFVDYWFEQLSVVVIFELLFFLNLKPEGQKS